MKKSKKKKVDLITLDPEYKPFIVMNEHLQVWVGIKDGGRTLIFSDNFDDAKPLHYEEQFSTLRWIANCKLEKEYI